jgi:N-acylglucosamine-6-phosphate 2-epimerase
MVTNVIDQIRGGVIISCQAVVGDPTRAASIMTVFAQSAERGGAVGIRANGAEDVAAIKKVVKLPMIGIWKRPCDDPGKYIITPSLEDARLLVHAGADIIAADVADRPRPDGVQARELIQQIRGELGVPFMADCADLEQALRAQDAGADLAATTLGSSYDPGDYEPNLKLLSEMIDHLEIPVVGEGRFWDPAQVETAFRLGAWAVVIGSAVTRPWLITQRFVRASPSGQ